MIERRAIEALANAHRGAEDKNWNADTNPEISRVLNGFKSDFLNAISATPLWYLNGGVGGDPIVQGLCGFDNTPWG